ncbi:TetR/AcrR family transcriptional regulator, partial [Streptomyces sp. SID11233]|nr:TetR/AcrR family transcriptional regulator [Streptomyces sp. SID11233]
LYVYVAGTTELHAAILDQLLGEVEVPGAAEILPEEDGAGWEQRLIGLLHSYTLLLFRYPGLARSALVARPSGPHYLDL